MLHRSIFNCINIVPRLEVTSGSTFHWDFVIGGIGGFEIIHTFGVDEE